jgi:hypothetical protein
MWYTTKANTGDSFTPVVVSIWQSESEANKEANRLHAEQIAAVDQAGTNLLPFSGFAFGFVRRACGWQN